MKVIVKGIQGLMFVAIALFMIVVFFMLFSKAAPKNLWVEGKFDVTINGKIYKSVDPDSYSFPHLKKGDEVTISKNMTNFDYTNNFLVLKTFSSTVDVYWDIWNIYSYGNDLYAKHKFIGRGYHVIELRKVLPSSPKLLIKLKAGEDMNFRWLEFLKFTSSNTIWSDIFEFKLASVALSMALFIVGFVGFVCFGVVSIVLRSKNDHLLYSFATAFFVGLWSSCVNGLFQKMTGDFELTGFLEYLSLYVIPYFYLSLIEIIKKKRDKHGVVVIAKNFYLFFVPVTLIFHITDIAHISEFASLFRVSTVIALALIFAVLIKNYKVQKSYEKVLVIGNVLSAVMISVQAVLLNLGIYSVRIFGRTYALGDFFITVPIVIVILAPLISYSLSAREMKDYETQISLLKNLAYKDSLTGLYNRHRGMAFAMELKSKGDPYSIIMIDLNNLKKVNDNFGHDRGDKLLVDFSDCLRKAFDNDNFLNIRQGGDEFVTVSKYFEKEKLEEYLQRLKVCVKVKNTASVDGCEISMAFGVARSDEPESGDYDDVLKLADERMYENKAMVKKLGIA